MKHNFFNLTKEQAETIRDMRENGKSWRKVAEMCCEMWPEKQIDHGNQMDGMELCTEAERILGEIII